MSDAAVGALIVFAAFLLVCVVVEIAGWRNRRAPERLSVDLPPRPLVALDWCCVCMADLSAGEVWAIREHLDPTGEEEGGGGSWVERTFCEVHAPADAMPPLRSDR